MEDATSKPHTQHLTVLPHTGQAGKVEQLKHELKQEREQHAAAPAPAEPQAAGPSNASSEVPSNAPLEVPPGVPPAAPAMPFSLEQKLIEGKVIGVLQTVFDPEIPVNIYELGLVYGIDVDPQTRAVHVRMTLTSPGCPVAGTLPGEVETKIEAIPEVSSAKIELVWDPPWSKDRMSEAAMLTLGLM